MCRNICLIESQEANRGGSGWNMEGVERTTVKMVIYSCRCRCRRALHVRAVDGGRCRDSGKRDNDDNSDEREVARWEQSKRLR